MPSARWRTSCGTAARAGGEAAKAFIKLRQGARPFSLHELQAFLADKVGRHEMPRALEFRSVLPVTPVGKLSKIALRDEERRKHSSLCHSP